MNGVYRSNSPTPGYRKVMGFIDGENLVFCYQSLINKGKIPKKENHHLEDIYVWNQETLFLRQMEFIRATYYTYTIGTEAMINETQSKIRDMFFTIDQRSILPNKLTPCVFKKYKKSRKTKGVDIKMTVDILSNVYQNNLDTVMLVAGDGDYLPIIKEIRRLGKQVYLAFFSTGLNESLLNYVDKYICLDMVYFNNSDE